MDLLHRLLSPTISSVNQQHLYGTWTESKIRGSIKNSTDVVVQAFSIIM